MALTWADCVAAVAAKIDCDFIDPLSVDMPSKSSKVPPPAIASPYSTLIAAIPWMAGLLVSAPISNLVTSPVLALYWITGEK